MDRKLWHMLSMILFVAIAIASAVAVAVVTSRDPITDKIDTFLSFSRYCPISSLSILELSNCTLAREISFHTVY
jgi:hypothetical protein